MNAWTLERKLWQKQREHVGLAKDTKYISAARRSWSFQNLRGTGLRQIQDKIRASRLLAIGDDRLVPQDQRWIPNLVKGERGKWIILTDRIHKKHQMLVRSYLKKRVSAAKLLKTLKIRIDSENDPEAGLIFLLDWARKLNFDVLVCGESVNLNRLDQILLRKLRELKDTKSKILLWTGSFRLAPNHLLKRVLHLIPESTVLLLQAADLRWKNQKPMAWAKSSLGFYAYLDRSPFLSLAHYAAWQNHEIDLVDVDFQKEEFFYAMERISGIASVKKPPRPRDLLNPFSLRFFQNLASGKWNPRVTSFLKARVERGESAVVPSERLVLLSSLEKAHIAEEAAHYIRLSGSSSKSFGYYRTGVEETLAFLASTWLDPKRTPPKISNDVMSLWSQVHGDAYRLGEALAKRWRKSASLRRDIREIWEKKPVTEDENEKLWQSLRRLV